MKIVKAVSPEEAWHLILNKYNGLLCGPIFVRTGTNKNYRYFLYVATSPSSPETSQLMFEVSPQTIPTALICASAGLAPPAEEVIVGDIWCSENNVTTVYKNGTVILKFSCELHRADTSLWTDRLWFGVEAVTESGTVHTRLGVAYERDALPSLVAFCSGKYIPKYIFDRLNKNTAFRSIGYK